MNITIGDILDTYGLDVKYFILEGNVTGAKEIFDIKEATAITRSHKIKKFKPHADGIWFVIEEYHGMKMK